MGKSTSEAVKKRIRNGGHSFFLGKYYCMADINGIVRRREQCRGYLPSGDKERVNCVIELFLRILIAARRNRGILLPHSIFSNKCSHCGKHPGANEGVSAPQRTID